MVGPQALLEEFLHRFPKDGKLVIDVQSNASIDRKDFKKKIDMARHFFTSIPHAPGDKVVLFMDNSIDYMVIVLALFDSDWVIVPLNPRLNRKKVEYLVRHSCAKLLITSRTVSAHSPWIQEIRCRTRSAEEIFQPVAKMAGVPGMRSCHCPKDDLKFIMYTSGTVGNPKGVMLSRLSFRKKIIDLITLLRLKPGMSFFSFLPFFSGHGMIPGMLVPLLSGCRMHIAKFDPFLALKFWGFVKKHRIHSFTAVPSILMLLKEEAARVPKKDLKCLRTVFSASSKLSQAVYDGYARWGIPIHNCYGLTETASWISVNKRARKGGAANCVGRSFGAEIGVFNEQGKELGDHQVGELRVKSAYNMQGYFRNPKLTRSCFDKRGYFKTGDVGYKTSDGRVFFVDRTPQIIIKNGINIYPSEVDQVFMAHPDVQDSISFGVPDERYGEEIVTALRVRDAKRSKAKYQTYASEELPSFLLPGDIFFPKDLPYGATGKPQVAKLREQYLKGGS